MIAADIIEALTPVVRALEALDVRYYVGGSVASSALGTPRATLDVDIVADMPPQKAPALAAALEEEYYADADMIRDAAERRASFNVVHYATMLKVDVFVLKARDYDRQAFERTQPRAFAEGRDAPSFQVASPEDVVLHKLEWFRLGHEISERQWHDVLGVLRVQRGRLNLAYMRRWASGIGVEDLLDRALHEAG